MQGALLRYGILNKRDLRFVGEENGTWFEYLTNVWYWDLFIGVFSLPMGIVFIYGIINVLGRNRQGHAKKQ